MDRVLADRRIAQCSYASPFVRVQITGRNRSCGRPRGSLRWPSWLSIR